VGSIGVSYPIASAADFARAPVKFISLANPDAVPAGKYAREWLERQGQWEAVQQRVLAGVDVRAALAAVEIGAAELGIVYATDAAISKKVRVLYMVPDSEGPRIRYPIAALRERPNLTKGREVVAWLSGPEAGKVFKRFGFILLEGR
jgi:molybdate transport system substrate-binding protein